MTNFAKDKRQLDNLEQFFEVGFSLGPHPSYYYLKLDSLIFKNEYDPHF